MGFTVTRSSRRVVMGALLCLAILGAAMRALAPDPSTARDIGTLLLVLWLPAVGNLIAYLVGRMPRRQPRRTDFAPHSPFAPHLQVRFEAAALQPGQLQALRADDRRCTLLVGQQGFSARLQDAVRETLARAGQQTLAVELLHPAVGLPRLVPGTDFHLLAGTTGVGKGRVLALPGPSLS